MEYCKENGYDLLGVIQVIGQGGAISHLRHQSVKKVDQQKDDRCFSCTGITDDFKVNPRGCAVLGLPKEVWHRS